MTNELLTDEHRILRDTVLDFARTEFGPIADEIDRTDAFPSDLFLRLGELGILGVTVPSEYGGAGADLLSGVIVVEQLARVSGSIALSYAAHANLCVNNLYVNGSEEQRRQYLPGLCSGELIGALAITAMFRFASLPMIERRMLERRPAYAERQRRVALVIPWPPRATDPG